MANNHRFALPCGTGGMHGLDPFKASTRCSYTTAIFYKYAKTVPMTWAIL